MKHEINTINVYLSLRMQIQQQLFKLILIVATFFYISNLDSFRAFNLNFNLERFKDFESVILLKVQSCKLYNNKYMIAATQITNTEIFALIFVLVFKLLSRKVMFINRKANRNR